MIDPLYNSCNVGRIRYVLYTQRRLLPSSGRLDLFTRLSIEIIF